MKSTRSVFTPAHAGLLCLMLSCGDDTSSSDGAGETSGGTTTGTATTTETGRDTSAGPTSDADTGTSTTGLDDTGTDGTVGTITSDTGATTGDTTTGTSGETGDEETEGETGDGERDDCPRAGIDCCPANPLADASLSGIVYAPNGTVPVSGAVVYTSATAPAPIPDTVYCAECLELTCGFEDYAKTAADGSFTVQAQSGDKYLVVQKGQFMRVTEINVVAGNQVLAESVTELPGEWDPANGLYMPKIAVANGSYDRLEDALGKMGLADTLIANFQERTVAGTESFDLWENGRDPATDGFVSQGSFAQLVSNPDALAQYHIIFVPCTTDVHVAALSNPQNVANIREWVEAGGRWYVADWANEWLDQVFPEYQEFYSDGFGNDLGVYDSLSTVLDGGLLTWLEQLPAALKDINPLNNTQHPTLYDLPQLMTVDNWSGVKYPLPQLLVDDGFGNFVNVGHKAWLEGPGGNFTIPVNEIHPLTITAQYGCGKLQFTSYHTAEFFDYVGLSPQELVLMYTILEIGVCQAELPLPT